MTHRFPIVGIGASAGGTTALETLFKSLPPDSGVGFLVVVHMPREYESRLPEIIGRCTSIPVSLAAQGREIEPNAVHIAPADKVLTIEGGRIRLMERDSEQRKPIDVFLASLAEDQGEAAVGILLSGADSDGTLGIKAIKERGGFTIAQGHDSTAPLHPTMPDAAIASGVIDLVLPVQEVASVKMVENQLG